MGLWFAAQTVNAVWLGLRPSSMRSQIAAAMSSAGLAAAFAFEARKLDDSAGKIAAPIGGGGPHRQFRPAARPADHRRTDRALNAARCRLALRASSRDRALFARPSRDRPQPLRQ